uniref:Uncharacterized protein n=1 Tax=viral metagenome TaxID=1070528 RepID=A0A6C0FFL0_9ZZZZ|tara:strand:+ start:15492 stop:16193 length:702 start_codon:yes stop_codon:yes gene_type:complete
MVYFVSKENQNLLWNVIHNNSTIQIFLKNMSTDDKNHWFRSIIEHFYKKYGPVDLSFYQLKTINKEVIIYIIQYVQKQNNQIQNQSLSDNFQQIQTPAYEKNNREEEYISQFEMRQKEYNQMLEKKAPDEINFSENIEKDTPIQDMKALMKKHIEERDMDISWQNQNPKLTINEEQVSLETNTIDEIKHQIKNEKRKISWEDEIDYHEKYITLKENYSMLYEDYLQMKMNKII